MYVCIGVGGGITLTRVWNLCAQSGMYVWKVSKKSSCKGAAWSHFGVGEWVFERKESLVILGGWTQSQVRGRKSMVWWSWWCGGGSVMPTRLTLVFRRLGVFVRSVCSNGSDASVIRSLLV